MRDSSLIHVQLRVGTVAAMSKNENVFDKSKLTIENLKKIVEEYLESFTLVECEGSYNREREPAAIIDVFDLVTGKSTPTEIYKFCRNIDKLLLAILRDFMQKVVIVITSISTCGREIKWSNAVTFDPPQIKGSPFKFPFLIARTLLPNADFDLPSLYQQVVTHYNSLIGIARYFEQVPGMWFVRERPEPLDLDVKKSDNSWKIWDSLILARDSQRPKSRISSESIENCHKNAEFMTLFHRADNEPVYYATRISEIRMGDPKPIAVDVCTYYEGFGCCEGLFMQIMDAWVSTSFNAEQLKRFFRENRDIEGLIATTFPVVGICALTLTPSGDVLLKRRAKNVGAYPNNYHVVPSGAVDLVAGVDHHPSVYSTFLRELDEEMFRGPEAGEYLRSLLMKEHISELQGKLIYLGYGIDLLRQHVEILLLFCPSEGWWQKFGPVVQMNWEYENKAVALKNIKEAQAESQKHPTEYVPAAYALLNLGERYYSEMGSF